LISGRTVTVWTLGGSDTGRYVGGDEALEKQNPFALFVKCRMYPLGPDDGASEYSSFSNVPSE